jgi:hypothetical protein
MRYTDGQLDVLTQFVKEEDIGEIQTMPFGTWTGLKKDDLDALNRQFKIVWLHDEPYEVQLIPKNLLISG